MSTEPNTPDVLDLDAMEVDDGKPPFQFIFDGVNYTCESPNGFDVRDLSDSMAGDDPAAVLVMMLGPDQWEVLDAAEKVFTIGHFEKIADAYFKHYGLSAGKSGGSPNRSTRRKRH